MHALKLEHKEILALIEEKMQHSFLEKYIKEPIIDKNKLYILLNLMKQTQLAKDVQKQYIITIMLVQIALDTHELVPISNQENQNDDENISMQLSVLAGDYYSGLYYYLLSEMDDTEMIQILASVIKEINEVKMILYYKEMMSFEKYLHYIEKVNALLIARVADHFNVIPELTKLFSRLLITNELLVEKNNLHLPEESPVINNWLLHSKTTRMTIHNQIEMIIIEYIQEIEALQEHSAKKVDLFNDLIYYLLDGLRKQTTSIVEEG